jgi:hypothetical protein
MVARAGLPLQDLEFVQFHPTGQWFVTDLRVCPVFQILCKHNQGAHGLHVPIQCLVWYGNSGHSQLCRSVV